MVSLTATQWHWHFDKDFLNEKTKAKHCISKHCFHSPSKLNFTNFKKESSSFVNYFYRNISRMAFNIAILKIRNFTPSFIDIRYQSSNGMFQRDRKENKNEEKKFECHFCSHRNPQLFENTMQTPLTIALSFSLTFILSLEATEKVFKHLS